MNLFLLPERVQIVFSVDPDLLALLNKLADQAGGVSREQLNELRAEVRAANAAMVNVIPTP